MNDDDLLGSSLSPAPTTSPVVRAGAPLAAVVLVMSATIGGCAPGDPPQSGRDAGIADAGLIFDGGIYPPDAPGVDTGVDALAPGVPAMHDAGTSPPDTGVDVGPPEQ